MAPLKDEPERLAFNKAVEAAASHLLSVANWIETSIVIEVCFRYRRAASARPFP